MNIKNDNTCYFYFAGKENYSYLCTVLAHVA